MGMMYAWATKEYLFWEMTIGQIIFYFNKGMEIKYPSTEKDNRVLANVDDLKKIVDEMKAEKTCEELKAQYGAIDG